MFLGRWLSTDLTDDPKRSVGLSSRRVRVTGSKVAAEGPRRITRNMGPERVHQGDDVKCVQLQKHFSLVTSTSNSVAFHLSTQQI